MAKHPRRKVPSSRRRPRPARRSSPTRGSVRPVRKTAAAARRRRLSVGPGAVVGAAALAAVIGLAVTRHDSTAGYDTNPKAFVLPNLGSPGKVTLTGLRGRPVVVNFFASWCTQCAAELPVFDTEARDLQGRVDFVEVNSEETGDGGAFADRFHLASSVTAVAHDVGGGQGDGLYQALGGNGSMPMTAFYGPDGSLLTTRIGAFDPASLAAAVNLLYGIMVPA